MGVIPSFIFVSISVILSPRFYLHIIARQAGLKSQQQQAAARSEMTISRQLAEVRKQLAATQDNVQRLTLLNSRKWLKMQYLHYRIT